MTSATTVPCLMIHGFTGGTYEVEPLARHLSRGGRTCRLFTLPGHDRELKGLGSVQWDDWVNETVREAELMQSRYGTFDVVGFSMGGLLAAFVANRFAVRRLVLLNAAAIYVSPGRFAREFAVRAIRRDLRDWNKAKKTPLRAMVQFLKLARELRPEFARVEVPTLVVQGERDPIVHPHSAGYIYRRLNGEKRLLLFPEAKHMICLEPGMEPLFEAVNDFLNEEAPT